MEKIRIKELEVSNVSCLKKDDTKSIKIEGVCGSIEKNFKGTDINFLKEGVFLKSKVSYKSFMSIYKQMVEGVNYGYFIECTCVGLGYRFVHLGDRLLFKLGYSHYIRYNIPDTVYIIGFKNKLVIYGLDLEEVLSLGNILKRFRKTDAYKGKGLYINNETIKLKVGKKR